MFYNMQIESGLFGTLYVNLTNCIKQAYGKIFIKRFVKDPDVWKD